MQRKSNSHEEIVISDSSEPRPNIIHTFRDEKTGRVFTVRKSSEPEHPDWIEIFFDNAHISARIMPIPQQPGQAYLSILNAFTADMFDVLPEILAKTPPTVRYNLVEIYISDSTPDSCIKKIPSGFSKAILDITDDHNNVMSLLPDFITTLTFRKNFPPSSARKIPFFINSLNLHLPDGDMSADFLILLPAHIKNLGIQIGEKTTDDMIKSIPMSIKKLTIQTGNLQLSRDLFEALVNCSREIIIECDSPQIFEKINNARLNKFATQAVNLGFSPVLPKKTVYELSGRIYSLRQTNNPYEFDFTVSGNALPLALISVEKESLSNLSSEFTPDLFKVLEVMYDNDTNKNAPLPFKTIEITTKLPYAFIEKVPESFETILINGDTLTGPAINNVPSHIKIKTVNCSPEFHNLLHVTNPDRFPKKEAPQAPPTVKWQPFLHSIQFDADYTWENKDGRSFTLRKIPGNHDGLSKPRPDLIQFINSTNQHILATITIIQKNFTRLESFQEFTPDMFEILFQGFNKAQIGDFIPGGIVINDLVSDECIEKIPHNFTEAIFRNVKNPDKVMRLLPININTLTIEGSFPYLSLNNIPAFITSLSLVNKQITEYFLICVPPHIENLAIFADITPKMIKSIPTYIKKLIIKKNVQYNEEIIDALASLPKEIFIECDAQTLEKINHARVLARQTEIFSCPPLSQKPPFATPQAPVSISRKRERPEATQKTTSTNKHFRPTPTLFAQGIIREHICEETGRAFFVIRPDPDVIELLDKAKQISLIKYSMAQRALFGISNEFTPDVFQILMTVLLGTVSEAYPCAINITDGTPADIIKKIPPYIDTIRLLSTNPDMVISILPSHIKHLIINQYFPSLLLNQIPDFIFQLSIEETKEMDHHFILPLRNLISLHKLPNHIKVLSIPFIATNLSLIKSIPAHIERLQIKTGGFTCATHKNGCNCIRQLFQAIPIYIEFEKITFAFCALKFRDEVKEMFDNRDRQIIVKETSAPVIDNHDMNAINETLLSHQQTFASNHQTLTTLTNAVNAIYLLYLHQQEILAQQENQIKQLQEALLQKQMENNPTTQSDVDNFRKENEKGKEKEKEKENEEEENEFAQILYTFSNRK